MRIVQRIWSRLTTMVMLVVALVIPFMPALAQGTDPGQPSAFDATCLLYGALTSVVVTLLKPIGFIKNNPKWVSLFVSVIVAGAQAWYHGAMPTAATLTACVLTQLSGAVATHEIVVKNVQSAVGAG